MPGDMQKDWSPETYARFRGLRLRPALDLLAQIHEVPAGDVIDLGCGNGPVGPALRARFTGRTLFGVDNSPAMLAKAEETGAYDRLEQADAAAWAPDTPPAVIFSNALCQWLPDHPTLFARLVGSLAPGGVLAVQMPRQYMAPSHALMRDLAEQMFPDRFDFSAWVAPVTEPAAYARLLAPLGEATVWEAEYIQCLSPAESGHPVRRFTEATGLRPFMAKLDEAEQARFIAAYEAALAEHYPVESNGSVLFPFRRVFFTLRRAG